MEFYIYICFLYLFLGSFLFDFPYFDVLGVFFFALLCYIIFYYYSLEASLFSNERQKRVDLDESGGGEELGGVKVGNI